MILKYKLQCGLLLLLSILTFNLSAQLTTNPVDFVDSRIGTTNDGSSCVIGPQLPFGSINPSPQTPNARE